MTPTNPAEVSILDFIQEYIPRAFADEGALGETDDHFMAGVFASYFKERIDAGDSIEAQACLSMANDTRLYRNESATEAMETTAFISIYDSGALYHDYFAAGLSSDVRKLYDTTIDHWKSQFTRPGKNV